MMLLLVALIAGEPGDLNDFYVALRSGEIFILDSLLVTALDTSCVDGCFEPPLCIRLMDVVFLLILFMGEFVMLCEAAYMLS